MMETLKTTTINPGGRWHRLLMAAGLAVALASPMASVTARAADLDEIKETQKKILERLDAQDKTLKDILQKLQAQAPAPARPQVDPNKVYPIAVGALPVRGPKDAKVTMFEFSDYQCPFCAQSTGLVDQLLAAYPTDLRFVYKHMPLVQIHQNAMPATKAAIAANKQGKYWEMHDELFKISKNLSMDEIKKVAEKLGLDMKKFEADMNSPETDKLIKDDLAVAAATDVTGTPSFFINGKRVTNRSLEGMKAMVEEELKKVKGAS